MRVKRSIADEGAAAASVETQSETQEEVIGSEENSTVESTENEISSDETANDVETTAEQESKEETSAESSTEVKEEEPSTENKVEESNETVESKSEEVVESEKSVEESVEEVAANVSEDATSTEDTQPVVEEVVESVELSVPVEEPSAEDLAIEFEIPKNLRPRGHIDSLLGLNGEAVIKETGLSRTGDVILKELKKIYDNAVKPLEELYKYRDLSNRHFGDPEMFSKPLILFMGPWSGGKSTILNYLTENEYTPNSVRSGN